MMEKLEVAVMLLLHGQTKYSYEDTTDESHDM